MTLVLDETMAASSPRQAQRCSLENYLALPDHSMDGRIAEARARLGSTAILLGHHYQRDEVIRFADCTGDSYKLSKIAAETDARYIVFCGVHFMAESADMLARRPAGDSARPECGLLHGRYGGDFAGGGVLGRAWRNSGLRMRPCR